MIDITKDIKNGTTTIVQYPYGNLDPIQVTVTKKKVKTAKGDFESIKVTTKPEYTSLDVTLKLLNVLEAVG